MIADELWFQAATVLAMLGLFAWAMKGKDGCSGDCAQGRKQCNCKRESE